VLGQVPAQGVGAGVVAVLEELLAQLQHQLRALCTLPVHLAAVPRNRWGGSRARIHSARD
jgi:hypothetical protein